VTDRVTASVEVGLREDVDRNLAEAVELADELQEYQRWITLVHQSWRAFVAGRLSDAEAFNDRAFEIGIETGQPDAFVLYAGALFTLRDSQGRWEELIPAMEQGVAENPDIAAFRACLAKCYSGVGQFDDARRVLDAEAATGFAAVVRDVVWATTLCIYGNVAADVGATEAAAVLLDKLSPYVHLVAVDGAHVYQPVAIAAGRLATLLGRPEAEAWLCQAEELARRFDAPVWLAEALLAQSELGGDGEAAARALAAVERLGRTAVGERARRHLDDL
jgi:tetratricopeptide (TPR) repeat protein